MAVVPLLRESIPGWQVPEESVLDSGEEKKKLESSIFNHISLGQWEAAKACVNQLAVAADVATQVNARGLLKLLIVDAANYWSESTAIPSPHHLSWLAFNSYKDLFNTEEDKLPDYLESLIEFRMLLFSCNRVVSFSSRVATQLCQYHAIHVLKIPGAASDSVPYFSGLIVSFIHDVITTISPALGHALITSLSVPNSSAHMANNESLQLIYIECINDCLDLLSKRNSREGSLEPDYDSQYESDQPTSGVRGSKKGCEKILSLIYSLLSLLDPTHEMVKVTRKIDTIFHTLLRKTFVISKDLKVSFETGQIYASLLGRNTPFLINRLHEVEEYLRMHPEPDETPTISTPLKLSLTDVKKPTLAPQDSVHEWRQRFYEALYDHRHLLESTLESGLQLVLTGQLPEVASLMNRQEWLPLRPIVLLMGWDKYPAVGSGKELLDVLWPAELSMNQQLLFNGCCKLAFQVELVQWCLEKAKPHVQHQSSFTIHRAGEMFKGLESHSTLFVLHHYTPLASLNPVEVIDILKMRPRVPLVSTVAAMTPPPQFSRGTTPMKFISDPESPPLLSPNDTQKSFPVLSLKNLQPEQERDISIYRSFCALRLVLDAVWMSVEISNCTIEKIEKNEQQILPFTAEHKGNLKAARKLDFGTSSLEDGTTEKELFIKPDSNKLYASGVVDKLQEAKLYISQIEPLNYRLELLEDVFSLLFLTSSDIKPMSVSDTKQMPPEDVEMKMEGSLPSRWTNEFSSAFSSVALIRSKAGFLIDERMASDLLLMLQDCINELRAAKFQQTKQTGSSHTRASCTIKSSIPITSLQQRSAQLEQYINEAKWRLQLVSSKSGILASPMAKSRLKLTVMDAFSSCDESASDLSESEQEEPTKKERKRYKKPGITFSRAKENTLTSSLQNSLTPLFEQQNRSRSPSPSFPPPSPLFSSSLPAPRPSIKEPRPLSSPRVRKKQVHSPVKQSEDDSGDCADAEDPSPISESKKKKRLRSRSSQVLSRKRRVRVTSRSETTISCGSFICQMLASPDSLLRMCVKHANYSRAKEVVKMFNMTGEFGDYFVDFSQQYELISSGLGQKSVTRSSYSAPVSGSGSNSRTPPKSSLASDFSDHSSSLSTINLQVAIQTASTCSETLENLHRLLAPSQVTQMLFSGDKALEKAAEESTVLQSLSKHVPVLVMLDIVCSSKLEAITAKRIVELATSRSLDMLQSTGVKSDGIKHSSRASELRDVVTMSGPFVLLQMFSDILGYFMNFGVNTPDSTLLTPTYSSPHTLLTTGDHLLQVESIVNSKTFLDTYREAREKVERDLFQFSSHVKKELIEELLECVTVEEPSSFSQHVKTNPVSVFDELIRALSGKHEEKIQNYGQVEDAGVTSFLWQFVRYVSRLLEFLTRCLGLGGTCPTKVSLLVTLLNESPSEVLGRLVFEQGITPQRLESLMQDFSHLHVVEVIIKCCCPTLPSSAPSAKAVPAVFCSLVALNKPSSEESGSSSVVTDLCSYSRELLLKLITIVKSSGFHSRDSILIVDNLKLALDNPELYNLFSKIQDLATVDLQLLDTPIKQMVFYSNIVNFLYIHSILLAIAMDTKPSRWDGLHNIVSVFNGSGLTLETVNTSSVIQSAYFAKVGYFVGQLGLISCYDLHHTILKKGMGVNDTVKPLAPDPWALYVPSVSDPRLVFVIHDGCLSSPIPVPLTQDNFEDKLSHTEGTYLSSVVTIDAQNKEVSVPEWLYNSSKELLKSERVIDLDLSLLKYIHSKLDKEKADILQSFIDTNDLPRGKKLSVIVCPSKPQIGFNFTLKPGSSNSSTRKNSQPSSRNFTSPVPVLPERRVTPKYTFTTEIHKFLEQQAPLLAALVYLLSPTTSQTTLGEPIVESSAPSVGKVESSKSFLKSFRNNFSKSIAPATKKDASIEVITNKAEDWQQTYDDILAHFSNAQPMHKYLATRLYPFNSVIPWDNSQDETLSCKQFKVSVRMLAALPSSSETLGEACSYVMQKFLENGQEMDAIRFLFSEPALKHPEKIAFLSDILLSCVFVSNYKNTAVDQRRNPITILSKISNAELATRLTLASLKYWPVEVCKNLLSYCLNHLQPNSWLHRTVQEKLKYMLIYSIIIRKCESPLHRSKSPWKDWYSIQEDSETRPEYVFQLLLSSRAFDVARQWASVHNVGAELSQQIEVEYLSFLLEGDSSNSIAAQQVLDNLSEDSTTLNVCESLLEHANLQVTVFVLHYMLSRLSHCLHYAKAQDYSNKLLGARALLCLPVECRKQYLSLITQPMLLVEQLLIDTKIDWACSVIQQLRTSEHLSHINKLDTPILEYSTVTFSDEEESHDPFLKTILFYCIKSLEFPQPILVQNTPAHSLAGSAMPTRPPSPGHQYSQSYARKTIPIPPSFEESDNLYPPATPRVETFSHRRRSSVNMYSTDIKDGTFKPPLAPPSRNEWEKDSAVRSCPICKHVTFGMFSRRHHCRRCGRVVCSECSTHLLEVKGYDVPVRTCNDCYNAFNTSEKLSETPPTTHQPSDANSFMPGSSCLDETICNHTLLPKDPMFNQNTRKEFYYERVPNTALFLSLVDLIVDKRVAASFILDCCHTVSGQLVPNAQGLVNEEVDHHFVIGLIQNLLQNAKVRFAEAEDSSGVELCDTYLSRVDLLRLLVSSRCPKIPSIQELTKPDLARRVRDKLMQSNRFKLAMEVSTKCQLDTGNVLAAWGIACLKYGDFSAARSKFKNCFQVSSHSKLSSSGAQNLQLLQRIVELIEQTPLAVNTRKSQYNEDWSSLLLTSTTIPERWSEECDLDKTRFEECVYYLRTYGSDSSLISFYVKHGCWLPACQLIRDKNCSTDVFIDHLWVPAMKTGQIEYVKECLQRIDSTLSTWEGYLTASCRYFTQKGLYSVLYMTQLFMKDYIRAGMTCIKFFIGFSGRSTSIADLFSRLHYLSLAKKHFQTYLDVIRRQGERRGWSRSSRQYEDSSQFLLPSVKNLTQTNVQQHLATIEMQTRVTHFLYQSAENQQTISDPLPNVASVADPMSSLGATGGRSTAQPATLFSNAAMRGEVAMQVITCSQDIIEGFEFAREVIQAYRLSLSDVYCGSARSLAIKTRYGDLRVLLQCLQKAQISSSLYDDIIMAAIKVIANHPKEAKQVEKLANLLSSEKSKIKGFILCGKLKSAYLVAVRAGEANDIRHISELAGKAGQIAVRDICQQWLQEHTRHR